MFHACRSATRVAAPRPVLYSTFLLAFYPASYQVNLFAHYRPKGNPNWWREANQLPPLEDEGPGGGVSAGTGECAAGDGGDGCAAAAA